LRILKWLEKVRIAGRYWMWATEALSDAAVTTMLHVLRSIRVDTPAHHKVEYMAAHEPRYDEETKHHIAGSGIPKILETLGKLVKMSVMNMSN
jgi:hypothetical protein